MLQHTTAKCVPGLNGFKVVERNDLHELEWILECRCSKLVCVHEMSAVSNKSSRNSTNTTV